MRNRNIVFIILGSALLIVVLAFVGRWAMHIGGASYASSPASNQTASNAPVPSVPDTGGSSTSSSGPTSGSTTPPITPTSTTITQADSDKMVTLKVGTRFLLSLGDTESWQVMIGDTSIVRRVPGVLTVRGTQGLFEVLRVGTTTLSAEGRPNCKTGEMCPQYIIDFKTTIDGV